MSDPPDRAEATSSRIISGHWGTRQSMIVYAIGLLGVAVFAFSGALAAGQKGFDWVGVVLIAMVTAMGGGTVRDVLLDREVFWIADPLYVWVTLLAAGTTLIYTRHFHPPYKTLLVADALGLAMFSIVGARIAETLGQAPIIVVVMGTITGVIGGVIRDILVNEVPIICRPTQPVYTFAAVIGILAYLLISRLPVPDSASVLSGIVVAASIRLAGLRWDLRLPEFRVDAEGSASA